MSNFALVELPSGAKLWLVISQQAQPNAFAKIIYHQVNHLPQVPGRMQAQEMVHSAVKLLLLDLDCDAQPQRW